MDISQLAFVKSSKKINEKSEKCLYKLFWRADRCNLIFCSVSGKHAHIESLNSNYKAEKSGFSLSAGSRLKKPATWRLEPSTFWGNRVKLESESLKLPTALSYQTAYFNILVVYLKH